MHSGKWRFLFCGFLVVSGTMLVGNAEADVISFTKVADTDTVVPGSGSGTFNFFSTSAVIRGTNVAFRGSDANFDEGIYLFENGVLSEVAFTGDMVPDLPGFTFNGFDSELSLEGSTVAFEGFIDDGTFDEEVVITATGGVLTNRADTVNTINPATGEVFEFVNEPSIFNGAVAFQGGGVDQEGIYTDASGSLVTLIENGTAAPGLAGFEIVDLETELAFKGNIAVQADIEDPINNIFGDQLLLLSPDGSMISEIANTINTISPTDGAVFDALFEFTVDGDLVAFGAGNADGTQGIYTNIGGGLNVVADETTAVPDQIGEVFTSFDRDEVSIDGNRIVFEANFDDGGETGIYLWNDGFLKRILDTTQMLDGKVISDLDVLTDSAVSGLNVAFSVSFDDGSQGIYFATVVPEPATMIVAAQGLLIAGGGAWLYRRRRRQS